MKNLKLVTATIVLLMASTRLFAQQVKGDFEIGFSGMYNQASGNGRTFKNGMIQGSFGFYVTKRVELGLAPSITINKTGDDTRISKGGQVFATYSFLSSGAKLVPYVGGGYYYFDSGVGGDDTLGFAGVNGGFKYYIAPKAAINFSVNYMTATKKPKGIDSLNSMLFAVGLSYLIKRS